MKNKLHIIGHTPFKTAVQGSSVLPSLESPAVKKVFPFKVELKHACDFDYIDSTFAF